MTITHLINSTVMPAPGNYTLIKISAKQFADALSVLFPLGVVKSYIGYPETIKQIKKLSGIEVPLSREKTVIADGDKLLIIKLNYRVDPEKKGKEKPTEDAWEYYMCKFNKGGDDE